MAYYIYLDMGSQNLWFWAYIVLGIAGFFERQVMPVGALPAEQP